MLHSGHPVHFNSEDFHFLVIFQLHFFFFFFSSFGKTKKFAHQCPEWCFWHEWKQEPITITLHYIIFAPLVMVSWWKLLRGSLRCRHKTSSTEANCAGFLFSLSTGSFVVMDDFRLSFARCIAGYSYWM